MFRLSYIFKTINTLSILFRYFIIFLFHLKIIQKVDIESSNMIIFQEALMIFSFKKHWYIYTLLCSITKIQKKKKEQMANSGITSMLSLWCSTINIYRSQVHPFIFSQAFPFSSFFITNLKYVLLRYFNWYLCHLILNMY